MSKLIKFVFSVRPLLLLYSSLGKSINKAYLPYFSVYRLYVYTRLDELDSPLDLRFGA